MKRFAINEGWATFFLIALVVLSATWSIEYADWADGLGMLTTITIFGLLVGLGVALARRLPSLVGHMLALAIGWVVVLYEVTNFLSDAVGGRRAKLHFLLHRWDAWFAAVSHGQRAEDLYLFILLMGALTWIMAYVSVWLVFRSRSVWLALLFPGIVVFTNLGYSLRVPTGVLILYLFAAMLLLMRFSFAEREERWRRTATPYPNTLAWRGMWVASYVAVAVLLFGWVFPVSPNSGQIVSAWNQVNGPWVQFRNTLNGYFTSLRGPGAANGPGGFAAFSDQFQVGGPLRLSNTPVVLVKGGNAPYLAAHTYSTFTGTSWQSEDSADVSYPPLSFNSGQTYPLPPSSSTDRSGNSFDVQVLQPRGNVVYTADELGSVSIPTLDQVSWYQYNDQPLDIASATQDDTPPLLWPLVQLLKSSNFTPQPRRGGFFLNPPAPEVPLESTPSTTATPAATPGASPTPGVFNPVPPELQSNVSPPSDTTRIGVPSNWNDVSNAISDLTNQHRIQVQVQVGQDFLAQTIRFSGLLPVYADLQAVYSSGGVQTGQTYTVNVLSSQATADALRQVPMNQYPIEITGPYLQLPTTVTQRVTQLAHAIGDPQGSAFDKASAIEGFLRNNYKYNEAVNAPPRGVDIVDYFLFDSKQGYCTYYSTAMVEMLRILGIPAREVVGFYPAGFDQSANGYLYRDLNAHAWVEAYFPGYGWIPFEPTAARAEIARYVPPTPAANSGSTSSGSSQLPPNQDGRLEDLNQFDPGGGTGGVVLQQRTNPWVWVLRTLVALLLIAAVAVTYLWLRGLRGLSPTMQLFTKLQRGAGWGGIPARSSMTPYEYAGAVTDRIPAARNHAALLADLYVRERYGARQPGSDEISRARHAWLRLRGLLVRHLIVSQWRSAPRGSSLDGDSD